MLIWSDCLTYTSSTNTSSAALTTQPTSPTSITQQSSATPALLQPYCGDTKCYSIWHQWCLHTLQQLKRYQLLLTASISKDTEHTRTNARTQHLLGCCELTHTCKIDGSSSYSAAINTISCDKLAGHPCFPTNSRLQPFTTAHRSCACYLNTTSPAGTHIKKAGGGPTPPPFGLVLLEQGMKAAPAGPDAWCKQPSHRQAMEQCTSNCSEASS